MIRIQHQAEIDKKFRQKVTLTAFKCEHISMTPIQRLNSLTVHECKSLNPLLES